MTTMTVLYALGGVLMAMIAMLVAVIVARSLDGSTEEGQRKFAAQMSEVAHQIRTRAATGPAAGATGRNWIAGQLAGTFSALAAASNTSKSPEAEAGKEDARKQLKAAITVVAIAIAVIGAVVGAILGDN